MELNDFSFRILNKELNTYEESDSMARIIKDKIYCKDISNYKIELWTGLYDKNKQKIYEGDIVRYKYEEPPLAIYFVRGIFIAHFPFKFCRDKYYKYAKDEKTAYEFWFEDSYKLYKQEENEICHRLEVIGNINLDTNYFNEYLSELGV